MPNHVTNIIEAAPHVLAGLTRKRTKAELEAHEKAEEERRQRLIKVGRETDFKKNVLDPNEIIIDFNCVVPLPDEDDPIYTATRSDLGGGMVGWSMDGLTPMDLQRKLWGTKWNAYDQTVEEGSLTFDTAWNHPIMIVQALSTTFPDEIIEVKYADEDLGSNCGHYTMKNGEILEGGEFERGDEANEFASQILYGMSYEEKKAEWDQEEIECAQRTAFVDRIKKERGVVNGWAVLREENLEVPQDILDSIQTREQAEAFFARRG